MKIYSRSINEIMKNKVDNILYEKSIKINGPRSSFHPQYNVHTRRASIKSKKQQPSTFVFTFARKKRIDIFIMQKPYSIVWKFIFRPKMWTKPVEKQYHESNAQDDIPVLYRWWPSTGNRRRSSVGEILRSSQTEIQELAQYWENQYQGQ